MARHSAQRMPKNGTEAVAPAVTVVVAEPTKPRKARPPGIGAFTIQPGAIRQTKAAKALQTQGDSAPRFGDALQAGFAEAVGIAVARAHAAGLAVPGRTHGAAVELRPDGELAAIEDRGTWSPENWKAGR